jgi:hypothetical protein
LVDAGCGAWFGGGFGGAGGGLEVPAVVDFFDDGKAGELDEVDLAEGELEEDFADGSAMHDADLLACGVGHNSGKTRPEKRRVGIP